LQTGQASWRQSARLDIPQNGNCAAILASDYRIWARQHAVSIAIGREIETHILHELPKAWMDRDLTHGAFCR
jgi:hypothetical protein